jgi:hypothetical protein
MVEAMARSRQFRHRTIQYTRTRIFVMIFCTGLPTLKAEHSLRVPISEFTLSVQLRPYIEFTLRASWSLLILFNTRFQSKWPSLHENCCSLVTLVYFEL